MELNVNPDEEYTRHRTQASLDNSPTGLAIRTLQREAAQAQPIKKISKQEAKNPTPQATSIPTGEIDIHSGQIANQPPQLSFNDIEAAKREGELNRQARLQQSFDKAPQKPPAGFDALLHGLDYPASKVRQAIANKINETHGTQLTADTLAQYIGGKTAPGDPIGQAVNTLITSLVTDPLTYLPAIGIPASAYKAAGQAIKQGAQAVGNLSKSAGVDLASESGAISTKLLTPDVFYSPTQRVIEAKVPNVTTPAQVQATLANSGVSPEEAKWMDLDEYLKGKQTVNKQELLDYVKAHQIEVKEVQLDTKGGLRVQPSDDVHGEFDVVDANGRVRYTGLTEADAQTYIGEERAMGREDDTKFKSYTLPGGTNYRELLLTLPEQRTEGERFNVVTQQHGGTEPFQSSHFNEPNILVHIRTNDRLDSEGKRTLFVEEIQSDWHQKGRTEGYGQWTDLQGGGEGTPHGVPDAPFKKNWHELAIKRVLRLAAEEGYERIAWTTGEQQAERYDLSKQVSKVIYLPDKQTLIAYDHSGGEAIRENFVEPAKLADYVGREAAEKLLKAPVTGGGEGQGAREQLISGLDLKVGGEGMKGFYDKIIPSFVNKYAKKWGGKVEDAQVNVLKLPMDAGLKPSQTVTVHSLKFTPEVTNAVINNPQSLMGSVFQTVDEHLKTLPKMVLNKLGKGESGSVTTDASLALTRAILGGLVGAQAGDEENAVQNAIIGVGLGALISPALIKQLIGKAKGLRSGGAMAPEAANQAQNATQAAPQVEATLDPTYFRKRYDELVETARRGVLSDKEVVEKGDILAQATEFSPEAIARLTPGTALNPEETFALQKVASQSLEQLIASASKVVDEASALEFGKAFWTHGDVFDTKRLGARAEAGRTTRLYGTDAPVNMQEMQRFLNQYTELAGKAKEGMSIMRLVDMVKKLETPEQAAIFARNAIKPGLADAMTSLWVNSLLSGPTTHAANILGNGATLTWAIAERQLAGLLAGDVRPNEAAAMVKGVFESFGDALKLFKEVAVQGDGAPAIKAAMQRGETKLETRPRISFAETGKLGPIGTALDYVSAVFEGLGGRPLLATDEFFKAIAFRAEVRARALREAYSVIDAEGLTGKAARDRVKQLEETYLADIPSDIQKQAEQFASYVTFTKELGPAGKWLADGSTKHPAVKLVIPFVRAPLNIFKFAGERTPFALMSKSFWNDIQAGGSRSELALAKLGTAAMIGGLGSLWAAEGFITGAGPSKKLQGLSDSLKEGGWQPYSINVSAIKRAATGGDSTWKAGDKLISYNRVEPLGMLLGLYANYVEIVSNAEADSDYEELANTLLMSTVKSMSSKTFIQGLARTTMAFAYPEEFMGDTIAKQAVSFVPVLGSSLSRKTAQTVDPVLREAEGFVEELMKQTPGLSNKLSPQLHPISGEPVYREGGVTNLFSPLYQSTYKDDPVINEIAENKVNLIKHKGVVKGVELTTDGKVELQKIITHDVKLGGKNLHDSLAHLFETATYKNGTTGPDGRRALLIKDMFRAFNEAGELLYLKRHPDVFQAVKDNYKDKADRMRSVPPSHDAVENSSHDLSIAGY